MFRAGVNFPIQGTGSSGRGFWERCSGDWGRGRAGSSLKAKNLVVVRDEELNKCSLVAGLQQGDH